MIEASPRVEAQARRRTRRGAAGWAVAVALVALALPCSAAIIDLVWNDQGRFERSVTVAPGKFAEVCGKLAVGDAVAWRFEAGAPLDFNIHHHVGKDVKFPERQDALAQGQGRLNVTLPQDYCWMWTNKTGAPVPLKLQLTR